MGAPGYSRSDFEPVLRIHEKIKKNQDRFCRQIHKSQRGTSVFFSLFPQECYIMLILPQIQSMGAPGIREVILDRY